MFPIVLLGAVSAIFWGLYGLAHAIGLPPGAALPYWLWVASVLAIAGFGVAALGRVLHILLVEGPAGHSVPPIARILLHALLVVAAGLLLVIVFGGNPLTLLTTSAVFSVFAGIALQPVMSALFSGAVLQFEKRVAPGTWLEVDGRVFKVETTSWRAITGQTVTHESVILPNVKLIGSMVVKKPDDLPSRSEVNFRVPISLPPHVLVDILTRAIGLMPHIVTSMPINVVPVEYRLATGTTLFRATYWFYNFDDKRLVDAGVMERIWYALQRHGLPIDIGAPGGEARPLPHGANFPPGAIGRLRPELLTDDPDLERLVRMMRDTDAFSTLLGQHGATLMYAPQEQVVVPPRYADHLFILVDGEVSSAEQRLIDRGVFGPEAQRLLGPLPANRLSPLATLVTIAQRLADDIGPAAEDEVRRMTSQHDSIAELCAAAARLIPDAAKRARFLADVGATGHAAARRPGLVFSVRGDLTGFYRPPVALRTMGFATLAALPRACVTERAPVEDPEPGPGQETVLHHASKVGAEA